MWVCFMPRYRAHVLLLCRKPMSKCHKSAVSLSQCCQVFRLAVDVLIALMFSIKHTVDVLNAAASCQRHGAMPLDVLHQWVVYTSCMASLQPVLQ